MSKKDSPLGSRRKLNLPIVVNAHGMKREDFDIYIGRWNRRFPNEKDYRWGNPFKSDNRWAENYFRYVLSEAKLLSALPRLAGKRIACWDVDEPTSDCSGDINDLCCHGQVLVKLWKMQAQGKLGVWMKKLRVWPCLVYTILHPDTLKKHFRNRSGNETQGQPWTTARKWFEYAGNSLPILFGDATDCSRLLYWAMLTKIDTDAANGTSYSFRHIRQVPSENRVRNLVKSTGEPLAPDYQRAYAICKVPEFVR
jgi:uncharacterized protein DUF4326